MILLQLRADKPGEHVVAPASRETDHEPDQLVGEIRCVLRMCGMRRGRENERNGSAQVRVSDTGSGHEFLPFIVGCSTEIDIAASERKRQSTGSPT